MKRCLSLVLIIVLLGLTLCSCGQREKTKEITKFSDNLYSYKVKLDGAIFKLPSTYYYLIDRGYNMEDGLNISESDNLDGGKQTPEIPFTNSNGNSITVDFVNNDKNSKPYRICDIGAINITAKNISFELPKGIKNDSTYDEIIKAYGEPNSYYESGNGEKKTMFYTESGEEKMITIVWDLTEEKIYQVIIKDYTAE